MPDWEEFNRWFRSEACPPEAERVEELAVRHAALLGMWQVQLFRTQDAGPAADIGLPIMRWADAAMSTLGLELPAAEEQVESQLRAWEEQALELMPERRPQLDLHRITAEMLPALWGGSIKAPIMHLLAPERRPVWDAYFDTVQEGFHVGVGRALIEIIKARGPDLRVLEFGCGTGGSTLGVLEELSRAEVSLAAYAYSDLSKALVNAARRRVEGKRWPFPVQGGRLDIMSTDDMASPPFDVVISLNALHAVDDIWAALQGIRRRLRPGGVLLLGEVMQADPGAPRSPEFPMSLLPSFWEVQTDESYRTRPGFLSHGEWPRLLEHAGFHDVRVPSGDAWVGVIVAQSESSHG